MSIFKRLGNLFGGGGKRDANRFITVYVLSHRCREPIAIRVDTHNEVSRTDGDSGFYVRKVIHTSGAKRCFDQVEVELWMNANWKVVNHEVQGGRWLDEAAYQAEVARFHAPAHEGDTAKDDTAANDAVEDAAIGDTNAPTEGAQETQEPDK